MSPTRRLVLGAFAGVCAAALAMGAAHADVVEDEDGPVAPTLDPSLCVVVADECNVPGAKVDVTVELGYGDPIVVGGHLVFEYDPTALQLINIAPGGTCDPASPFTFEIAEIVDEVSGEIIYATHIDPAGGTPGTAGPATMACLEFVVLDRWDSSVCLLEGEGPLESKLVDQYGHQVSIDNSPVCPPVEPPPAIACGKISVAQSCVCGTDTPDCSVLENDCNAGVCNSDTVACEAVPINEGGPCDDGDTCTDVDTCINGICVGTGCSNPSLCVFSGGECDNTGRRTATIMLGDGDRSVVGAQFSLDYNPAVLRFIDIAPGSTRDPLSPFEIEMKRIVDEEVGEVFYAVAIDPFSGGTGTNCTSTLAFLEFQVIGIPKGDDICVFNNENPLLTLIADVTGHAVPVHNSEDCPTNAPLPAISCDDICIPIPTVSEWGLVVMTLLLLTIGKVSFALRRSPT